MIEEEHIRFVAAADVTDDCRVEAEMRKRRQTLTATQARDFAAELVRAAKEAERAAFELARPGEPAGFDLLGSLDEAIERARTAEKFTHPECAAGKCGYCDGQLLSIDDRWVPCSHHCHTPGAAA